MKHLILLILILNGAFAFGQPNFYIGETEPTDSMERAWFYYQLIDSLVFPDNSNFIIVDEDFNFLIDNSEKLKNKSILIQNSSNDTIIFPTQDGSMICILEAENQSNEWKPIQYWWISWCGNSFSEVNLNPKHSIHLAVDNIRGETESVMRIRIHGNDIVFVSEEFYGKINESSFLIPEKIKLEMREKGRFTFLDSAQIKLTSKIEIEIIYFEEE